MAQASPTIARLGRLVPGHPVELKLVAANPCTFALIRAPSLQQWQAWVGAGVALLMEQISVSEK
jgi:hypothetical protein